MWTTADLCDQHGASLQVAQPHLHSYGGASSFCGPIATTKVNEDNTSVRLRLQEPGMGRVLVVDGGGSLACALVGDQLAQLASDNGWAGIIVNGCIRDSGAVAVMQIGVMALATMPRKSEKRGPGDHDIPVSFAGVTFTPGAYLYADGDGIVVAPGPLDSHRGEQHAVEQPTA
jgi:regulator of ribonuclease activity A